MTSLGKSFWSFSPAVSANAPRHIRSHNRLIAGQTLEGHIHAILGGTVRQYTLGDCAGPVWAVHWVLLMLGALAVETPPLLLLLIITTWVSALLVFYTHTPLSRG